MPRRVRARTVASAAWICDGDGMPIARIDDRPRTVGAGMDAAIALPGLVESDGTAELYLRDGALSGRLPAGWRIRRAGRLPCTLIAGRRRFRVVDEAQLDGRPPALRWPWTVVLVLWLMVAWHRLRPPQATVTIGTIAGGSAATHISVGDNELHPQNRSAEQTGATVLPSAASAGPVSSVVTEAPRQRRASAPGAMTAARSLSSTRPTLVSPSPVIRDDCTRLRQQIRQSRFALAAASTCAALTSDDSVALQRLAVPAADLPGLLAAADARLTLRDHAWIRGEVFDSTGARLAERAEAVLGDMLDQVPLQTVARLVRQLDSRSVVLPEQGAVRSALRQRAEELEARARALQRSDPGQARSACAEVLRIASPGSASFARCAALFTTE